MFAKKIAITLATAAALGASAFVSANPLQPNYYAAKSSAPERATGEVVHYVSQSPLTPTFSKSEGKAWIGTGSAAGSAFFIDSRNPLYPQYKRS